MATYKYISNLHLSNGVGFDQLHNPGVAAPYPGIYKCVNCGDEIAIAGGHVLPPQNHHQHGPLQRPIQWQLVVAAIQK